MTDRTYDDGVRDGRIEALEKRAEDTDGWVTRLAEQMNSGFKDLGDRFDRDLSGLGDSIRVEFRPMSVAIQGNGDPSRGLVSRMAAPEESVGFHRWIVYGLLSLLAGGVVKAVSL
jgi:hypothetical protein